MRKPLCILLVTLLMAACASPRSIKKWVNKKAPETFSARFETTKGTFEIEVERSASPKAVDRLFQLLHTNYFNNALFYRVVPGFVAQFGGTDELLEKKWSAYKLPDELVLQGNRKGTISFARGGKTSRDATLFINLDDNSRLDTLDYKGVVGFPTFGKVTQGMEVVTALHSGYGDSIFEHLDVMYKDLPAFLKKYPDLDKINKAYILK